MKTFIKLLILTTLPKENYTLPCLYFYLGMCKYWNTQTWTLNLPLK